VGNEHDRANRNAEHLLYSHMTQHFSSGAGLSEIVVATQP
jgi:hypothetical protein